MTPSWQSQEILASVPVTSFSVPPPDRPVKGAWKENSGSGNPIHTTDLFIDLSYIRSRLFRHSQQFPLPHTSILLSPTASVPSIRASHAHGEGKHVSWLSKGMPILHAQDILSLIHFFMKVPRHCKSITRKHKQRRFCKS